MMVRLEDTFVTFIIPHLVYEANRMEVSKVQLESWHVAMAVATLAFGSRPR
jgi:hypothetical protein